MSLNVRDLHGDTYARAKGYWLSNKSLLQSPSGLGSPADTHLNHISPISLLSARGLVSVALRGSDTSQHTTGSPSLERRVSLSAAKTVDFNNSLPGWGLHSDFVKNSKMFQQLLLGSGQGLMARCSLALQSLSLLTTSPLLSNTTIMPPQLEEELVPAWASCESSGDSPSYNFLICSRSCTSTSEQPKRRRPRKQQWLQCTEVLQTLWNLIPFLSCFFPVASFTAGGGWSSRDHWMSD